MFLVLFILFIIIGIFDLAKINRLKKQNDLEAQARITRINNNMKVLKELQNKQY